MNDINRKTIAIVKAAMLSSEKLTRTEATADILQVFNDMLKAKPHSEMLKQFVKRFSIVVQRNQAESEKAFELFVVTAASYGMIVGKGDKAINIEALLTGDFGPG